ncbi:MAG: polysaccharide deacetylase family protein [Actinomycetota bacterium]|nr:polysaccharide deacetylase family protein [Actinomycetota bacterium]
MSETRVLPDGVRVALSLSFDDARDSQLDVAAPILDAHGVRASFFVLPAGVRRRRDDWRRLVRSGHEMGNHTGTHPCSGNFTFSTSNALEDYTLERMEGEIDRASGRIEQLLGVRPKTFAYPCGQSFVGRGEARTSYVPLVARRFLAARGYNGETANDPARCDLGHLEAFTVDGLDADALVGLVGDERAEGRWVVMAGHDVGEGSEQTVLADALAALCRATDQGDVWVAPIGEIAMYVRRVQTAAT